MRGTHQGLRQHGQTSRIVPEIDRRWHFVDLACNAASQTSGDGANSPIPLQAGEQRRYIASGSSCWIRAERGLSERPGPGGKTILSHEGTHLRFLQSRSTGAARCVVVVWSVQDNICFDPYLVVSQHCMSHGLTASVLGSTFQFQCLTCSYAPDSNSPRCLEQQSHTG